MPKKFNASMVSAGPPPALATIRVDASAGEARDAVDQGCTSFAGGQIRDHIAHREDRRR